jgi:hypothetical protein
MLMLKRLVVWSVETLCEVPLLMALLMLLSDLSHGVRGFDLGILLFATFVFMVGSGYLITTAVVGVFFRGQTPWLYPTIAASLFVIHEQFFLAGWARPDTTHIQVQVGGASIVFATTLVGGWVLRKWSRK